ncbi:MAG: Calx-beta domain-containing protein, partial [Pyrinomonadaceae bacterium]
GAGGRVTVDFHNGYDTAVGVAAAPGGRILVGGQTHGPAFAAARLNADGSPDNTFGVGGRAVTRLPSHHGPLTNGLTATTDGKLVIVGLADHPMTGNRDIAVARYAAPPGAEPASFARFSAQDYGAAEGCTAALVTVLREGDLSAPATVEYRTRDGSATQRSDYTHTTGALLFAAGESSKSFALPVNDDALAEGPETIRVELVSASANVNFRVPAVATLTVADDDTGEGGANPLDNSQAFVCQHYHDFLSRQPDAAGLQFWTQGIEQCGADARCREVKRVDVSTAFFLSIEFQQTAYFVIRAHKAGFGDRKQTPRYFDFLRDTQRVAQGVVVGTPEADARLEANKQAFAAAFVARPEFVAAHGAQSATEYVDSLYQNAGVTPTPSERAAAVAAFGAGGDEGRAAALRSVVESDSVYRRLYNAAFVLSQYFGYLRRDPDAAPDFDFSGYDFWLAKLDSFSLPNEDVRDERVALARVRRAEMVKAFVTSLEYRRRFGQP